MTALDKRTKALSEKLRREFDYVVNGRPSNITLGIAQINNVLWLTFSEGTFFKSLSIPLPIKKRGLTLLKNNGVTRVVCDYWLEIGNEKLNYHDVIERLLTDDVNVIFPAIESRGPMLRKIISAFYYDNVGYMVSTAQKLINQIVNVMPLHETDMNSWAMNRRLVIIDPMFDVISDPNKKLEYQVEKNKKYYKKHGWTAIGLSDGVLADKNYLLTVDLRKHTPFGMYHNPQRNLYSTLAMKGDELPRIRSRSMQNLMDPEEEALIEERTNLDEWRKVIDTTINKMESDLNKYGVLISSCQELVNIYLDKDKELKDKEQKVSKKSLGVSRKGWNLMTAVLDTPLNFEDQILVDHRHRNKFHKVDRKFQIFGEHLLVNGNDPVEYGDVLGYSGNNEPVRMNMRCDDAKVTKITKEMTELNNEQIEVFYVTITGRRYLRDGSKFSNLHGNKGVIRFVDLGYAIHPKTGEEIKIDVMISGMSINKRKNFGQIMEALCNNIADMCGNSTIVVEDDFVIDKIKLEESLESHGFPKDGSWMINTYCGEFQAIVGKMFWGITKDPEDQAWEGEKAEVTNNRELRTSGLKFSHVEMKSLVTRFGPGNALLKEILDHSQGVEILHDEIKILHSAAGRVDDDLPVIDARDVPCVNTSTGIFYHANDIAGTIVDEEYMPGGFVLKLPVKFQAVVDNKRPDEYAMGLPQPKHIIDSLEDKTVYEYDKIFIPNSLLRRCWKHPSGKWGLSVVGIYVNRIVEQSHKLIETCDHNAEIGLMRAVASYFMNVSWSMGTKRGELSTYGMAVRYPKSCRGTAVLSDTLPKNTVEIHEQMAKGLGVKTGDVILAERFPCLGFVSIRPQFVRVTDDPMCRYVIRVSGNSLTSMSLDFDGDTLFGAAFHNPEAVELLKKEMANPNPLCEEAIERINASKIPQTKETTLDDLDIHVFPVPTNEEHAELVRKATGVKSHTGPVIALAYNLMRIVERNVPYTFTEDHVHLELLLDFLGNTVFKQKHGIRSLQEEATDAICMADVQKMVDLGFERRPSQMLCDLIRREAASLGIRDLVRFHIRAKSEGRSKIINFIVRRKNRVYFATRARLGPFSLLDHITDAPVDLPSWMLSRTLASEREKIEEKMDRLKAGRMKIMNVLTTTKMRDVYNVLANYIDGIMASQGG